MPTSILMVIVLLISGAGVGWIFLKMVRDIDNWFWYVIASIGFTFLMVGFFEEGITTTGTAFTLVPLASFIAILAIDPELG